MNLINAYRNRGHLFTKTNPVRERRKYTPTLEIENFGLSEADMDTVFQSGEECGIGPATLRDIIKDVEETYCQSIGIEYTYMRDPERIDWFKNVLSLQIVLAIQKSTKLRSTQNSLKHPLLNPS